MTRQQIMLALKNAGIPLILAVDMDDEQLSRYAETSCRDRLKKSEAEVLRRYAIRNRQRFARFGQTPESLVKGFMADKATCFAEEYAPGSAENEKNLGGPRFSSTGDEKDTPERKMARAEKPSASLGSWPETSTLSDAEKSAKMKEAMKVRKWCEGNAQQLARYGSTPERTVQTFMADDDMRTAEQFIGK